MRKMNKKTVALLVVILTAVIAIAAVTAAKLIPKQNNDAKEEDPNQTVSAQSQEEQKTQEEQKEPSSTKGDDGEPAAAGNEINLEATQAELDELLKGSDTRSSLLGNMDMTMIKYDRNDYKHATCGFDPATAVPEDYLFCVTHSYFYAYCFGTPQMITYSESEDPFSNGYEHAYFPYKVDKLDWVSENMLNLGPVDVDAFTAVQEDGKRYAEYKDGVLYMYSFPYGFESGFSAEAKTTQRLADGSYQFTIGYEYYDGGEMRSVDGEGTLIAAIREIDGIRIWSILSYTADLYIQ